MYDFSWSDPVSWIAIGLPVAFFGCVVVSLWEVGKLVLLWATM